MNQIRGLGRVAAAVAVLSFVMLAGARVAAAEPITIRADVHFVDPLSAVVSAACGFPVVGTIDGTEFDHGVRDQSGDVFRELDISHGRETVSASVSGKSFSFPVAASFHYAYPDGNSIGDRAVVTVDGFVWKLPGVHAEAGRIVYGDGVIVSVDPSGFPRVAFGAPTSVVGNRIAPAEAIATVCASLA